MSELLLRRAPRPVCPFCKEEVAGGLIWVCPGCEASHHAECQTEHGACASCALAPAGRVDPKASDPADEALAARRAELERLGFEVDEGPPGELRAVHAKWIQPGEPAWLARRFTVVVRRLERLTLERLGADRATLVQPGSDVHPLAVVVCYLADEVDPGAQAAIEAGFGNVAFFPASLNLATCEGSYLRSTKIFGAALYPSLRYLARRLLFPQLAPEATLEPLAGPKIAAFFATVLMLFGAFVLQLIAG